jgi:hypothetical protein
MVQNQWENLHNKGFAQKEVEVLDSFLAQDLPIEIFQFRNFLRDLSEIKDMEIIKGKLARKQFKTLEEVFPRNSRDEINQVGYKVYDMYHKDLCDVYDELIEEIKKPNITHDQIRRIASSTGTLFSLIN